MENLKKYFKCLIKQTIRLMLSFLAIPMASLYRPKRNAIPPIEDKILLMPAIELSEKIRSGELTSEKVVSTFVERIKQVNPIINAVVQERYDTALREAREIDRKIEAARSGAEDKAILNQKLVGVPLTIKETIALEGSTFSAGLPSRRFKKSVKSSPAVENLKSNGKLVPVGTTNTPCMNSWWDSYNLHYGRTGNPYDLSRIVGGSSGGEAAILASAGSVVGVGSDLGGSIRIPGNFCGVFGHKPTPFCVSNEGAFPKLTEHQEKLRGIGPMTRYACDLLPMLELMIKEEISHKLDLNKPVDLKSIKIFYCEELNDCLSQNCDEDILLGLRAAVDHLSSKCLGGTQQVCFDEFKYGMPLWAAEYQSEEGKITSKEHEDGMVTFEPLVELFKTIFGHSEIPMNSIVSSLVEKLGSKYGSEKHRYLTKKASDLRKKFTDLVGENGVLLMPTHPEAAPQHLATIPKILNVSYTAVANVLQSPITQCPLGMTHEGLPFGVQVIATPFNDRLCLAIARELESAFGGWYPMARDSARWWKVLAIVRIATSFNLRRTSHGWIDDEY